MTDTPVQAVGRRKSAVARVTLRPGTGRWEVNGRTIEEYFPMPRHRDVVARPLGVVDADGSYDLLVRVRGGGQTGQAGAVQLAVARALVAHDPDRRSTLRSHGLLTRDPRSVERKKPGQPKARKRFQFSKR
ncbi:MAG: 30S ribosomal protein S9 [Gemmatimonadota bacterium]|nr:MAG: 30S ribosomal protein S9 [Gemmatimonadota bacterium]